MIRRLIKRVWSVEFVISALPYVALFYFLETLLYASLISSLLGILVALAVSFVVMLLLTVLVVGLQFRDERARIAWLCLIDIHAGIMLPVSVVQLINGDQTIIPVLRLIFMFCEISLIFVLTSPSVRAFFPLRTAPDARRN